MHDMQSFRQLQQATNTSADGGSSAAPAPAAPAPPAATAQQPVPAPTATAPAPVAAGPPDITIVTTARDLQQASLNPNTTDIEIRSHLDMRDLERPRNPDMPGSNSALSSNKQALIYASKPLRSIRGNCSDPAAAAALNLTAAEADQLLPIKPFQCLIVVDDTWLMVNNGVVWVDNLHLKIIRRTVQPILPFISAGLQSADTPIGASQIYATNITFQAEHRGSASAIFVDINEVAVYVDDCIVSDWAGFRSPFVVKFQSVLHIRNTIFLNSYLYSELVDVSFEGIVRFEAVSLANVSLTDGAVVDTTLNDYQQAIAYYLNYYAEDDEAYDVEVEPVPAASRGMFGAEFVIPNATMSDCVYTLGAGPGVVYPGCPPESEAARERLKSRSLGSSGGEPLDDGNPSAPGEDYSDYVASVPLDEDFIGGQGVPFPADYQGDYAGVPLAVAPGTVGGDYSYDPNDWFDERLLQADDPWLVATRQVLPQRLPTPETWPPFTFERAPLQNRTSLLPPTPAVSPQDAAHFLGPLNLTAGPVTTSAAARDIDEGPGAAGIAGIVLGCLAVAVVATMLAVWASRRGAKPHPKGGDSHAGEAMLVGFTSDTTTDASQSTGQAGARLPRGALIPEDYPADDGKQVNSVMNPSARYEMSKPDPGPIIFGEDLKASKTGTKSGFLPDGSPMSEQPALIYFSSTQPSDESRDDESNHSDSGTVLGAHHRRMMQSFSKPDPEPASPLASASTQDRTPPRTGPTRRGGPGPGLGGANGTVDGTIDDGTVDGTIDQTTLSASDAASPSPLGPPAEIRSAAARGSLAPVTEPGEETTVPRSGAEEHALRRLLRRLDTFKRQDLLLGKYQVLGRQQQRLGGQAVVQFVRGAKDRRHYAVKFFLDPDAFFVEAALYAACFPEIQKTVSPEIAARAVDVAAASSGDDKIGAVAIPTATARFLPQVEAVCDGSAGDLVDPSGRQLPPCIVMEKGESLQDWSSRAEPDFFTVLSVLSNISLRLADMHDAGYVHRDLKPANVMWLPRENRWTVIDFGCVAGVGEVAPLSFTLAYAPPEVVAAFLQDKCQIESTPALDAWSLGVMAYEMLSGESAFDFLTHGRCRVIAQLRGELPLPWEQDTDEGNRNKLGAFKGPVLQLLQRDPARRVSMRRFHDVCSRLFASRTAEAQEGA